MIFAGPRELRAPRHGQILRWQTYLSGDLAVARRARFYSYWLVAFGGTVTPSFGGVVSV